MATFAKDILYPGVVHPPDLDGPVTFSPEDSASGMVGEAVSVPFLGRRLQDMLADGLQIPFAREHQDLKPMTSKEWADRKAELTKLALGQVTEGGLTSEGWITAKVDVPVAEDAKRLPAIRFASPEILWNVTDGNGKLWPGPSITHLAATQRPVQHKQKPFELISMSLITSGEKGIRLSMADYKGIRMSEEAKEEEEIDTAEEEVEEAETEEEDAEEEEGDVDMKLKEILQCLRELKMELGGGVDKDNFIHRLHPALKTHLAHEQSEEEPGMPQEHEADLPSGVALSMANKLADLEKKDYRHRIKAVCNTGRRTPAWRDKALAMVDGIQLSMNKAGNWKGNEKLLAMIEAAEDDEPNTAWNPEEMGVRLSGGEEREVPLPANSGAPLTSQQVQERVEAFRVTSGGSGMRK